MIRRRLLLFTVAVCAVAAVGAGTLPEATVDDAAPLELVWLPSSQSRYRSLYDPWYWSLTMAEIVRSNSPSRRPGSAT